MPNRRLKNTELRRNGHLGTSLIEMSRHPLIELADQLSEEAHMRKQKEGDSGPFIDRLAEFLQDRAHAIIGGLGVRAYLRERPTMDFDLMIDRAEWNAIRKFLSSSGAEATGSIEDTFMYRFRDFELQLDVRIARSALDRNALESAIAKPYKGWKLRVVRAEFLCAMKVKAYSERKEGPKGKQDAEDVRHLVAGKHAQADAIRSILRKHRPELLAELEEILSAR